MLKKLRELLGDAKGEAATEPEPFFDYTTLPWIPAEDNRFGLEVIDLQSFSSTMTASTGDTTIAMKFLEIHRSVGTEYRGLPPRVANSQSCALTYRLDPMTEDGVLFLAAEMEDKWCVYTWDDRIYFVRSWTGDVIYVATTQRDEDQLTIIRVDGGMAPEEERKNDPDAVVREVDFLMKSLVLGEIAPAPLPASVPRDPEQVATWCWSMFGRTGVCASFEDDRPRRPESIFRANSLLLLATENNDIDTVREELAGGTSPSVRGRYHGITPLHAAATFGHREICELLIESGAALEPRTEGSGLTPLLFVTGRTDGDPAIVRMLVDRGADLDARSNDGASALHGAIQAGASMDILRLLIELGLDPDAKSTRGFTPLHIAAEKGRAEAATLLLASGADPHIEAEGHTARSLAEMQEHAEIMRLLDAAGD